MSVKSKPDPADTPTVELTPAEAKAAARQAIADTEADDAARAAAAKKATPKPAVKPADTTATGTASTTAKAETTTDGKTGEDVTDCVVDDGTRHNGMAVNGGKVCSAHENRYYPTGKPRP